MTASQNENQTKALSRDIDEPLNNEVQRLRDENRALMDELTQAYEELAEVVEVSRDETEVAYGGLREKLGELVRLGEVGRILSSELKLDVLIDVLVLKAKDLVGYDYGCFIRTAGAGEWEVLAEWGVETGFPGRRVKASGVREVLVIGDFDRAGHGHREFQLLRNARSGVAMPLGRDGYGVLVLNRYEPHGYKESDKVSLSAFAAQASIAIDNARLFDSLSEQASILKQKSERLSKIWEVTGSLLSSLNLDSVLNNLLKILCNDFGFKRGAIGLLDKETGFFKTQAVRGYPPELLAKDTQKGVSKEFLRECLEERQKLGTLAYFIPCEAALPTRDEFIVSEDGDASLPRAGEGLWHSLDLLILTLVNRKQEIVGYILPDSPLDGRVPSKELITELEILANLASVAIENAKLHNKMTMKVRELEALYRTTRTISSTIQLDTLLDLITEEAKELGEGRKSAFFFLEEDMGELVLERSTGFSDRSKKKLRYRVGEGSVGKVILTGEGEVFQETKRLPAREQEFFESEGIQSLVCVPVRSRGKVLGALLVGRDSAGRAFTESDLRLISALGDQASVALQNAIHYSRAQKSAEELSALLETSSAVLLTSDTKSLLSHLAAKATELLNAQNCTIFLLDRDKDELTPIVAVGPDSEAIMKMTLKTGEGITGWVAKTGIPQRVNHAELDPRSKVVPGTDATPESLLSSPLSVKGKVVGVMTLGKTGDLEFTEENLRFLINISNQAAMAVEKSRLIENLIQSYDTLKTTQEQLVGSERLKALGEMAAGVAHDFNNVLGSILARVQLLRTRTMDEFLDRGLQLVEKAALDGAETIRRIQDFTRTRTDEDFKPVDINGVIRDSIEMTGSKWKDAQAISGRTIDVSTELGEIPQTAGNQSELREVLTNIIMNAVDAMPEGGKIVVRSWADGLKIHVSISDTGIGMSKEIQTRIFEPFFTTKGVKGNGLGLSVSYGIIARHKGKIEIESAEGKGTTFTIQLPLIEGTSPDETEQADTHLARRLRVLVVDDEEQIRDVLKDILVSFGHRVDTAQSGRDALELAKGEEYEMVLTDLGMPEISGWELSREIKMLREHTVVVLVTGWGVQLDLEKTKRSKVDFVMNKPFQVSEVKEILARASGLLEKWHKL